jgi:hypothetical protein
MAQDKGPFSHFPYKDLPEVTEVFADDLELTMFNGSHATFTFTVDRVLEFQPPKPKGYKATAARLVLTPNAMLKLVNNLNQIVAGLEKSGAVKREEPAIIRPKKDLQ